MMALWLTSVHFVTVLVAPCSCLFLQCLRLCQSRYMGAFVLDTVLNAFTLLFEACDGNPFILESLRYAVPVLCDVLPSMLLMHYIQCCKLMQLSPEADTAAFTQSLSLPGRPRTLCGLYRLVCLVQPESLGFSAASSGLAAFREYVTTTLAAACDSEFKAVSTVEWDAVYRALQLALTGSRNCGWKGAFKVSSNPPSDSSRRLSTVLSTPRGADARTSRTISDIGFAERALAEIDAALDEEDFDDGDDGGDTFDTSDQAEARSASLSGSFDQSINGSPFAGPMQGGPLRPMLDSIDETGRGDRHTSASTLESSIIDAVQRSSSGTLMNTCAGTVYKKMHTGSWQLRHCTVEVRKLCKEP